MKSVILRFFFGMLIVQMVLVWDEVVGVLEIIVQDKDGEEVMSVFVFEWLVVLLMRYKILGFGNSYSDKCRVVIEFDCMNVLRLEVVVEKVQVMVVEFEEQMLQFFDDRQQIVQFIFEIVRLWVFKVFDVILLFVEWRLRQFSLYFLFWVYDEDISFDIEQDLD